MPVATVALGYKQQRPTGGDRSYSCNALGDANDKVMT
jgi:hypothetical protein